MMLHRALAGASLLALLSNCQSAEPIQVRAAGTARPVVEGSASAALAEANTQFALGNPALALEKYRAAAREDPNSVAALSGIAASYQALGRPELARRHYELALAVRPDDRALLTAVAGTLDAQGQVAEAALVRSEIGRAEAAEFALNSATAVVTNEQALKATRSAPDGSEQVFPPPSAVPVPSVQTSTVAMVPPIPARTVTVKLPPARPVQGVKPIGKPVGASVTVALAPPRKTPALASRVRLDRLSLTEVALTTATSPTWQNVKMATAQYPVQRRGIQSLRQIQVHNGARVAGLASSTRDYLQQRGWRGIQIGDAQDRRERTIIFVPRGRGRTALALAAQFRFPVQIASSPRDFVVVLGRDAAAMRGRHRG